MIVEKSIFPEIICPIDCNPLEIKTNHLICKQGHRWSINKGIPQMISDQNNYTDAFGLQWNTYRTTQLDSYTRTNISYDRLRKAFGEKLWERLHGTDSLSVLEAGCGAGRFTEVLLNTPAAFVTSIDYSSAVEANQLNFPQNRRHRICRANILSPPFKPKQFDIVLCLGVVQHTPDPEQTIKKLFEQVKPGGWLIFDHYTYSISRFTKSSALIRPFLKRMSPRQGLRVTELLTKFFLPLHKVVRKTKYLQMLLSRISPILSYYHVYPELNDQLQYEWALLDTHDTLTDYYKHLRSKRQISKFLSNIGGANSYCEYEGSAVLARSQKPAPK